MVTYPRRTTTRPGWNENNKKRSCIRHTIDRSSVAYSICSCQFYNLFISFINMRKYTVKRYQNVSTFSKQQKVNCHTIWDHVCQWSHHSLHHCQGNASIRFWLSGMFLTILIKLNTAYLKLRTGIVRKVKKNNIPSVHKYISTKKFSSIIYKESQYMRWLNTSRTSHCV
jgi:hypothetical protein